MRVYTIGLRLAQQLLLSVTLIATAADTSIDSLARQMRNALLHKVKWRLIECRLSYI